MPWAYLVLAGLFETAWAVGLPYTKGFTRLWPSVWTLIAMLVSIWLLSLAVREIPIGTSYAVWTAIGATGTAVIGMLFLGEPRQLARIGCIGLIVAGTVGLKFLSPST